MLSSFTYLLFLGIAPIHAQNDYEVKAAMVDAHKYLTKLSARSSSIGTNAQALPNSNKIGLGYNTVTGSPVCYTGECQMEGFARPIFKLDYSKQPTGSCTTKLIPDYVSIDCLSSASITSSTEIIDSLENLFKSTASGIETSVSARYGAASFSYTHSSQTRAMIDTMIRENSTVLFTTAKISSFKLSSFAPRMQLSDDFRFVITRLPCCSYSQKLKQYIFEYIFNYFGSTYIKDLLLGGIAQQKITITEEDRRNLVKNDFSMSNSVLIQYSKGLFGASAGLTATQTNTDEKVNIFKKYSKQSSLTTLGGDSSIQSIESWSKTVPSDPIIIKFGISYIFDLLTEEKFPNDTNISKKAELIQIALNDYMANPVFCYKNCTRGQCKPSGYFQFGLCQCDPGYFGFDCSRQPEAKPVPSGTLCGFSFPNKGTIPCGNTTELNRSNCSPGYTFQDNFITSFGGMAPVSMGSCFKTKETNQFSPIGTMCGFTTKSHRNPITIHCNGSHPFHQACPKGYERQLLGDWSTCVKMVEHQDDLPGTLCGMHAHREYNYGFFNHTNYRCNGYDVENGYCPPGYKSISGMSAVWNIVGRPNPFITEKSGGDGLSFGRPFNGVWYDGGQTIADVYLLKFCIKV